MEDNMIEIKERDLHEIEFFLNQSTKGHHLLFDRKKVVDILKTPTEKIDFFKKNDICKIQNLLTELIAKKSLQEKIKYLNSLDNEAFEIILRTYFHIVDNAVLASTQTVH